MKKRLDLKVGFKCNNNCLSCPQAHRRHLGDQSTEEIKREIEEGYKNGANELVFTGGEPTMREDLPELVKYAKNLGYEFIQLQTNGRRLYYKAYCKELVNAGITEFGPAIHGHNAEIHDFLTRSPGAFKQAVQGVKNLKELNQRVIMNSVISKVNYEHLPEIAQLFIDLNVDQFQFAFIHCTGNAWKNIDLLLPKKSKVEKFVHKALDLGEEHNVRMMVEAYPYCFMQGYEEFVSQLYMPPTEIRDAEGTIKDFDGVRRKEGKRKGPKCKECKYFKICEGPWKEYPEKFGWSEFKPVEGKRIESREELLERCENG